MTKIMTESGWVYVVLVVDWFSKKIVGHHAGYQSRGREWLQALGIALQEHFSAGVRGQNQHLMTDNRCQPAGTLFMCEYAILGIKQAFTSYNNPKTNADTERIMRTIKEKLSWLDEWQSLAHVASILPTWIKDVSCFYLHYSISRLKCSRLLLSAKVFEYGNILRRRSAPVRGNKGPLLTNK